MTDEEINALIAQSLGGGLAPATVNLGILAQGRKARSKPPMQMKPVTLGGLLDASALATSPVPVLGDLVGLGADAYRFATEPESRTPVNYGLAALGLLPFLPAAVAAAGLFKGSAGPALGGNELGAVNFKTGLIKNPPTVSKFTPPQTIADKFQITPSGNSAYLRDNFDFVFKQTPENKYVVEHLPQWGSSSKKFYGEGDDLLELLNAATDRLKKSDAGVKAIKSASLGGRLEKEFGEGVFSFNKSERSGSQYITHGPSGAKIRISDHDLPLGYVQADLDLPSTLSTQEKFEAIRKFLKSE